MQGVGGVSLVGWVVGYGGQYADGHGEGGQFGVGHSAQRVTGQ